MVDLLDNFQDLIKLFLAVASNFMKDRWKRLKQKLSQIESPTKHILSKMLSAQHKAEYLGLPGIK
jgi:hypothetical protein